MVSRARQHGRLTTDPDLLSSRQTPTHMRFQQLAFLACSLLLAAACKKEDDPTPTPTPTPDLDYTSAADNARAEDAFNDMLIQVEGAVSANGLRGVTDACAPVVTFDTISAPHTLTIDYGSADCTELSGRTRRGRIDVSYTGHYHDIGTVITITPQSYYVNGMHLQGSKTVINMGPDNDGHPYFTIAVTGSLSAADGSWTATHQATRTRTWTAGSTTPTLLDDEYTITGNGTGVNRNGVAYTVNISNALHVSTICPFITQGTVVITPEGHPEITIDCGNGACDATYTVTVSGHTYTLAFV
jgi:hypothetical protein